MTVRRRRFLLWVALGSSICARSHAAPARDEARLLRLGLLAKGADVVFRATSSVEGHAVRAAAISGRFSHVGIAVESAGTASVIHALPPDSHGAHGVIQSSWREFALAPEVRGCAIYRVRDLTPTEATAICETARSELGRPFNRAFASTGGDGIYCTQLVLKCLERADPHVAAFMRESHLPLVKDPVIVPDALLAWPRLYCVDEV